MKNKSSIAFPILGALAALVLLPIRFELAVSLAFAGGLLAIFVRDYARAIPPVGMPGDDAPAAALNFPQRSAASEPARGLGLGGAVLLEA